MRRWTLIPLAALGFSFLGNVSPAQVTNIWPAATKLESFDTNISSIVVRATTEIGVLSVNTGAVSVRCREITEPSSGHRELGIALEITRRGQGKDTLLIDYDEISALLSAFDYLSKLDFSVTSLNAFDAAYTTKGGFRVASFGIRRTGAVQFAVRDARTNMPPVVLSRQDMSRLVGLVEQAKKTLDSLRGS
jgi:hypothetical protein